MPSNYKVSRISSKVSETGLCAGEDIPIGAKVILISGQLLHARDTDLTTDELPLLQVDTDYYLLGLGEDDDFINHSCDPNLATDGQSMWFYAIKNIKKGEELNFDYSAFVNDPNWFVTCLCGTANCRGKISGFQSLTVEQQESLLPYARTYLREWYKEQKHMAAARFPVERKLVSSRR